MDEVSDTQLHERFGLTPTMDIELDVGGAHWVGVTAEASEQLQLDVLASVVARLLGNRSLDHTRKTVAEHFEPSQCRDEIVRSLCHDHMRTYDQFYRTIEVRTDAPLGVYAFDLMMVRGRTSIEVMLLLGRQGYLMEPCLLARALVEQMAYAKFVWDTDDDDSVFENQPQKLLTHLKAVNPSVGRAYGSLSRLSHYDPKLHYSFIGERDGSTVLSRSWKFKVASLAWLFFILDLKYRLFEACYGEHENFAVVMPLRGTAIHAFEEFFNGVGMPAVNSVRELLLA